jgi:hypothetical protein
VRAFDPAWCTVTILKRPTLRQFFRDCPLDPDGETQYILRIASGIMESATVQHGLHGARDGLSQGAYHRKAKRTIERLFRDGRVGSATSILESVVSHLEKDIVAPSGEHCIGRGLG